MIDLTPYTDSNGDIDLKKELIQNLAGIVDSGSNENGTYIQFSDGIQICYSMFIPSSNNDANGATVTLPASFTGYDKYSIHASARGVASGGLGASHVVESISATSSTFRVKILVHTTTTIAAVADGTVSFSYIAIGRWK